LAQQIKRKLNGEPLESAERAKQSGRHLICRRFAKLNRFAPAARVRSKGSKNAAKSAKVRQKAMANVSGAVGSGGSAVLTHRFSFAAPLRVSNERAKQTCPAARPSDH
jgi:hypothetical protein